MKVVISFTLAGTESSAFKATFSKNGSTCFSEEGTYGDTGPSATIKDPSGATIATLMNDASGDTVVTCGGQTYTQRANCDSGMTTMAGDPTDSDNTCTMGECSP